MSVLFGRNSTRWLAVMVLASMAVLLTACTTAPDRVRGLLDGAGETPAGGVDPSGRTFVFTGLSLEQLDSYTASYTLGFEGEQAGGIGVDIDSSGQIERQRDPKTLVIQSELSGDGMMQGMSVLGQFTDSASIDAELINMAGRIYLTGTAAGSESICRSVPTIGLDPSGLISRLGWGVVQIEELLNLKTDQQPVELTLVGTETVNGVQADHYNAVDAALGSLTSGTVDLWYVPDAGYITRLSLDGQGDIPLYGSGALDLTYDVLSTNQPLTVTAPTGCTELSLEDLPLDQFDLNGQNLEDLNLEDLFGG